MSISNCFSFYAHKGGVGKSTLLNNFASFLRLNGKDVIVLDFDPQMNTSFSVLEKLGIPITNEVLDSLISCQNGVFQCSRRRGETIENFEIKTCIYYYTNTNYTFVETVRLENGIRYLLGSPILDLYDPMMTKSVEETKLNTIRSTRVSWENIRDLLTKVREDNPESIILIDMPPGINTTNKLLLMFSKNIVIPVNKDYYSLTGLKLISRYLVTWKEEYGFLRTDSRICSIIFNKYKKYGKTPEQENLTNSDFLFLQHFRQELGRMKNFETPIVTRNIIIPKIQDMMKVGTECNRHGVSVYEIKQLKESLPESPLESKKLDSVLEELNTVYNHLFTNHIQ